MGGKTLALAVIVVGLVAIAFGTLLLYQGQPPPTPERPKPPPPPEVMMNSVLKYSVPIYQAQLETDARKYKVPAPTLAELAQPNRYFEEMRGRHRLKAKAALETPHLRIGLAIAKTHATLEGQSFAMDHLVLRIENRTEKYLAYRVKTDVADKKKCSSKGDLGHNAISIAPRETIVRTECLYRNDESVDVTHVEVMELLPLEAFYVSRLPPNMTLYDPRTAAGHIPLGGALCPQTFSWREIQDGIDRKQIGWRDVIDFYARHSCDDYSFFPGYRYRKQGGGQLPARPLD